MPELANNWMIISLIYEPIVCISFLECSIWQLNFSKNFTNISYEDYCLSGFNRFCKIPAM